MSALPVADQLWYCLSRDGMAMLCRDEQDAKESAAENQAMYPNNGPYRVAQMVTLAQAEAMVAAERDRIRALVEAVRDANAAEAHGDYTFRVLTAQQERAWVELMDALNVLVSGA